MACSVRGLLVILEHLLETLAGEEDTAFYGAEWKIHLLGNFVILVSGHVHGEGDTVIVGEGVDGRSDFAGCDGALGSVESRFLGKVEMIEVFGLVDDCGGAHYLAVIVDEDVAHDGEDPSLEVYVFNVLVFVVKSLEGGILQEVVCVVAVGGQQIREVEQVALEAEKLGFEIL